MSRKNGVYRPGHLGGPPGSRGLNPAGSLGPFKPLRKRRPDARVCRPCSRTHLPELGAPASADGVDGREYDEQEHPNRCEAHRPAPCESPRAGMRAGGRFVEARTTRGTPDGVANHTDERASCSTRPRPHATHLLLSSARVLAPAAQPLTHWPCSTVRLRMFVATPLRGWGFRNPMGGYCGPRGRFSSKLVLGSNAR